jgi:hypothetical protein
VAQKHSSAPTIASSDLEQPYMLPKPQIILCDNGHTRTEKNRQSAHSISDRIFCRYFYKFSRVDFATHAAQRAGIGCDHHHISGATHILGLSFRNAFLKIPDEGGS